MTTEVMSNIYCYFADLLDKHKPDTAANKKGRSTTTNSNINHNKIVIEAYMSIFMNIEHITQVNSLIATIHTVYIHLTPTFTAFTATTQSPTTTDGAHRQSHLQQHQQQQEQQEQQSQDVVIATAGAIRVIECLDRLCIYYSNLFSLLQHSTLSSTQTLLTRLSPTNQHTPITTDINTLISFYINMYDKTQCTISPYVAESTRPNDDLNRAQFSVLNTLLTTIHTILETIPITLYIHLTHTIIQTLCIHLSQGITQNYDHNITINSLRIIKLCIERDNTTTTTTTSNNNNINSNNNTDLDTPKNSDLSTPKIEVKYTALFTNAIIRKLDYIYTTTTTHTNTSTNRVNPNPNTSSIYNNNMLVMIECINTIIDMHSSDDNELLHIFIKYKVSEKLGMASRLVEELLTTQYNNRDLMDKKDDISDTLENVYAFIIYKNEYMRDNNIVFT